jgi:tRNA-binding protein
MHLTDPPDSPAAGEIDFADFRKVDIRIGTVLEAAPLEGARKPAIRMVIDFGTASASRKARRR